jgi:hypothetical protein
VSDYGHLSKSRQVGFEKSAAKQAASVLLEEQAKQGPAVKLLALGHAQRAVELLADFVSGAEDCPPAVRRLAALDLLTVAGVIVTGGKEQPIAPSAKPITDLTADELRQLLGQQRATLEGLQRSIAGQVIEGERVSHGEHRPESRIIEALPTDYTSGDAVQALPAALE